MNSTPVSDGLKLELAQPFFGQETMENKISHSRPALAASIALSIALLLAACGGGSGDEDASPVAPVPGTPVAPGAPTVPAGTPTSYPPGSTATLALDAVNKAITHCGYPAMVPVLDLSGAAKGHARYVALNGFIPTHDQIPGAAGFTGATIYDRVIAAGGSSDRAYAASEGVGGFGAVKGRVGTGLLSAPYHQANLLNQWSEIGIGASADTLNMDADGVIVVFNYGGTKRNTTPKNEVRTYPCQGSELVDAQGGPEIPDPLPGLNGNFGPGINFETNKEGVITVDSISLRSEATGEMHEMLPINTYTLATQPWRSVWVSKGYLKDNTSYRVEARGKTYATTNGNEAPLAWERSYAFRTF